MYTRIDTTVTYTIFHINGILLYLTPVKETPCYDIPKKLNFFKCITTHNYDEVEHEEIGKDTNQRMKRVIKALKKLIAGNTSMSKEEVAVDFKEYFKFNRLNFAKLSYLFTNNILK